MDFSLFFFADTSVDAPATDTPRNPSALLVEAARLADRRGFTAVWTPEPHLHPFGGIGPNPALTAAAVAAATERIEIRAGSVVGPQYDPIAVADEWAVVDNLSGGRVALSYGPGWPSADFVLPVETYVQRREVLLQTIDSIRRLWRQAPSGTADATAERIRPVPVRPEVPVWFTSAGSASTFQAAADLGAGLITHLLCHGLDELEKKIIGYREAYAGSDAAQVALMLPTFLGDDPDLVRETVRIPYMRTKAGLLLENPGDLLPGVDPADLDPEDLEFVVEQAFERYLDSGGLFGRRDNAARLLDQVAETGVDEVVCMIDLDADADAVLAGLDQLAVLKDEWQASRPA